MKVLADRWIYIRVRGDTYRPVSIHPENPCGCLISLNGGGREIGATRSLPTALTNADKAAPAKTKKPGNKKPEHVVQAGLIHHALKHDMLLNGRMNGFSGFFEELIFVTDELKAGNIRADIIALGGKSGKYFPVFIELKAGRDFKRVVQQLIAAQQETAEVKCSFVEMLVKGTGKTAESISFDEYRLFVAWPGAESGKGKASVAKAVSDPLFRSASGHLLLGEFNKSAGFDSVVRFVESA